jgi:N-acetylneuraminic acid mutarotase
VKTQNYSNYFGLLAMSVALVFGSASCRDDATDTIPSSPADGGAQDGGASGVQDGGASGVQNAGTGAAGGDGGSRDVAGPVRVRVSGSAQKGPLIAGSSVTVFGLDSTLEPTGTSFPSQTEDDLGSFDVSANLTEELIEVMAQGPFYDELTGRLSDTGIVLRALASALPNTDIRVNLLTTASKERIRFLVGQGQAFDDAVAQAEHEVLRAFGIEDDSLAAFTAMDITGPSPSDAALIAVSAILLQYADDHSSSEGEKVAKLSLAVSTLASDLKEDGVLDNTGLRAGLPAAAARLNVAAVTANLGEIYSGLGQSILVADIQPFVATVASLAPWRFATTMPVARYGHCACAVDDKIYVMGASEGPSPPLDDVFLYDPATGQSAPRAKMPTVRAFTACSVVDGIIYVIGGYMDYKGEGTAVDAYDPAQDAWTTKKALPFGRLRHTSATVNGKIYVMGGLQESSRTDSVVAYDPAQDAWQSVSPLPTSLSSLASATVSGKIYTFGGQGDDSSDRSSAVYEYDPIADTWASRASMREARVGAIAVALGGRIYVIGGASEAGTVEEYDPPTDSWTTKTSMNVARYDAPGVVSGDLAYVIGGSITSEGNRTPSPLVETYDPTKDH